MQDAFHDGDDVFAASTGLGFSHSNILITFYALLLISFTILILHKVNKIFYLIVYILHYNILIKNNYKEIYYLVYVYFFKM